MSARKAFEVHNNDAKQVQQYLDTALRLTAESDLGDVSPDVFFVQAVHLLSGKQVGVEHIQAGAVPILNGPR